MNFIALFMIIYQLCLDEIGAIVCDVGSNTIRVGYAGEDSPRFDIPTNVGTLKSDNNGRKYHIGIVAIHVKKPGKVFMTF